MSTINAYDQGDLVRISAAFTVAGVATDPTTVVCKVKNPAGTTTTYTYGSGDGVIVKESTGNYHVDWSVASPGDHYYRWVGTGTVVAASEGAFHGKASAF